MLCYTVDFVIDKVDEEIMSHVYGQSDKRILKDYTYLILFLNNVKKNGKGGTRS